jgi:hypothetical protein
MQTFLYINPHGFRAHAVAWLLCLVLSGCCGGLTPNDLLWRTRSQYATVYPISVRNDSIILGGAVTDRSRYLVLDENSGMVRGTLPFLEQPNAQYMIIGRLESEKDGDLSRYPIPVNNDFLLDSLALVFDPPNLRGGRTTKSLSMRRRADHQWSELKFDGCRMGVNDVVPYKDRFVLIQYLNHDNKGEYQYEVGLLDLATGVRWHR